MSDYSMFSLFAAGLACMVPFTAAYTQPTGSEPKGNPISEPGLNSIVPAGKPFTVTWQPTTPGTVTLVLLKGPSTNAQPQYPIVQNYDNNGTFVWTPSTDLVPTTDANGYGIQLIVDATGQYQYTTQFGISNAGYKSSGSSSSAASSTTCTDSSSSAAWTAPASNSSTKQTKTQIVTGYTTFCPNSTFAVVPTGGAKPGNLTAIPAPYTAPAAPSSSAAAPTAYGGSATASASQSKYTGAASTLTTSFAGLVLAAGAAVFAL